MSGNAHFYDENIDVIPCVMLVYSANLNLWLFLEIEDCIFLGEQGSFLFQS